MYNYLGLACAAGLLARDNFSLLMTDTGQRGTTTMDKSRNGVHVLSLVALGATSSLEPRLRR